MSLFKGSKLQGKCAVFYFLVTMVAIAETLEKMAFLKFIQWLRVTN